MAKSGSQHASNFLGTFVLFAVALILFGVGESLILTRTDSGRLVAARFLRVGDAAKVNEILGRNARAALDAAGVPRDSIVETVRANSAPHMRWRVGLKPLTSTLQTNYALSAAIGRIGGTVLSGRERVGPNGETIVSLVIGLPGRPTHAIDLVRPGRVDDASVATSASGRVALVLFALGEDLPKVTKVVGLPHPFAVAIPPGQPWSTAAFRTAHEHDRELLLHLPLEPINYPQVTPGPGAILVTMSPSRISAMARKYLDQARPVVATVNLMGSLATQDQTVVTALFRTLREKGVPFLHMMPAAGSVCRATASDVGVAYEEPDVVIDTEARLGAKALDRRWHDALDVARRRGQAIVMLRATDEAIEWLPIALSKKRLGGVEIVPVTTILRRPIGV